MQADTPAPALRAAPPVSRTAYLRADLRRSIDPSRNYEDIAWRWRPVIIAIVTRLGCWAVIDYRFRRWARTMGPLASPLRVVAFFTRKFIEMSAGISIESRAEIGPGFFIGHFGGIFIGPDVRIGANASISQGVTVGEHGGSPRIGNSLYAAAGAKVFGPIEIGDDVIVGANAVVHRDVPSYHIAVGVPARLIPRSKSASEDIAAFGS